MLLRTRSQEIWGHRTSLIHIRGLFKAQGPMNSLDSARSGEYPTLAFGCRTLICSSWTATNTNVMNTFCCEPRVALRCCDTAALEICSYRYSHAMLVAMASLCNSTAVNWWVSPSRCGLKSKLRGFPSIQISVYLVVTPVPTLAWSDPFTGIVFVCFTFLRWYF